MGDAVVDLFPSQVLVQLLLGHIRLPFGAQDPEGALSLLAGLDVLGLMADHKGHVLLQGDVAVPVRIHSVQDGLKLRVGLPFLHHGQVIAQGAQTGFELLVVQPAGLVLVKVFEHHAEFFEGLLGHFCRVPGLDLLLQVVLPLNSCLKDGCPIPTTEKSKQPASSPLVRRPSILFSCKRQINDLTPPPQIIVIYGRTICNFVLYFPSLL